jgi:hypothetical protein
MSELGLTALLSNDGRNNWIELGGIRYLTMLPEEVAVLQSQLKEAEEKIKNLEWNVANWERKESLQASCCWENEKAAKQAEEKLKIALDALNKSCCCDPQ